MRPISDRDGLSSATHDIRLDCNISGMAEEVYRGRTSFRTELFRR